MVSRLGQTVYLSETEALTLALELKAAVPRCLLEGQRRGHLPTVGPVLDELVAATGFWISKALRDETLVAADKI